MYPIILLLFFLLLLLFAELGIDLFFFRTFCLQAFKKAWIEACDSKDSVLVVPINRTYHLKPITFKGPCKSNFTLKGSLRTSLHAC
jgi:hypothetical protein